MGPDDLGAWRHDHTFGQEARKPGESRTLWVIAITATMMIVEIAAGLLFGSMALLADGLHMASHTAALGIAAVAYIYARRHAGDPRYSFGTGKVNALAGFASAILLAAFALLMVAKSVDRFLSPVTIQFDQAIVVTLVGLVVNGVSAWILRDSHDHHHDHGHDHHHHHGHDHNLRGAYLHVLADALTSVLAIVALTAGKFLGFVWMDPVMGIVGAVLVARWSVGLLRDSGTVLLDRQASPAVENRIRTAVEADGSGRVADLHVWSIGPGMLATTVTVVADRPRSAEHYRGLLPADLGLVHSVIEVHVREDG